MAEQDFTSYDAQELAQEAGFIRWVRGTDAGAVRFWEQWLAAHPERAATVAEARRLVLALRFEEKAPAPARIDDLWSRIDAAIDEAEAVAEPAEAVVRRLPRRRWLAIAAAACAAILLITYWWTSTAWQTVEAAGQELVYSLPDGSTARLTPGSTLSLRPNRWSKERNLRLVGEAFFDVRKGPAFQVETENGRVQVLGTTFTVLSQAGQFAVDCFTGRVRVTLRETQESTTLEPGQGARLAVAGSQLQPYTFDPRQPAEWPRAVEYYESVPLNVVFERLEQQFGITIDSPSAIADRKTSGFYYLNNVDSALYYVTWPMNLEFDRQNKQVVIREKK